MKQRIMMLLVGAIASLVGKKSCSIKFMGNGEVQMIDIDGHPSLRKFPVRSELLVAAKKVVEMYEPEERRSYEEWLHDEYGEEYEYGDWLRKGHVYYYLDIIADLIRRR